MKRPALKRVPYRGGMQSPGMMSCLSNGYAKPFATPDVIVPAHLDERFDSVHRVPDRRCHTNHWRTPMPILLWLIGIPIPIILLLILFFH